MNEKYDSIIIECSMYRAEKELKRMKEYTQIIDECCNGVTSDNLEKMQLAKTPIRILKQD